MLDMATVKTVGGKFTQTVKAVFSDPGGDDCFVPGWDRKTSGEQGMARAAVRKRMGRKMTPVGRGTLRPSR
jgi:hypothetical protein